MKCGLPAKLRWTYAFIFFEDPVQMTFIGKVQFECDLVDAHGTVQQSCLNQFEFVIGDVLL
jgi:hypothetical protein